MSGLIHLSHQHRTLDAAGRALSPLHETITSTPASSATGAPDPRGRANREPEQNDDATGSAPRSDAQQLACSRGGAISTNAGRDMTDNDDGEAAPQPRDEQLHDGPLVFVSHDSRDASVAEAFSKLLASVSAGMLKSFRSSDKKGSQGFEYGVEWFPELMNRLETACDVVCLLTERSLNRPWILYEAGVAKGKLNIPVHGLALGVPLARASTGPFAQFQNCDDDVESITKLVVQLVRRLPHADPDEATVRQQVEVFRATVEEVFATNTPDADVIDPVSDASTAKLFEEIKLMFQDLPSRLEHIALRSEDEGRGRLRRIHPGMIEEIVMMTGRGEPNPGLSVLILASLFRDEVPWLYEIGAEAYRAGLAGDRDAQRQALATFRRAAEVAIMGPWSRELRINRDAGRLLHDLTIVLEDLMLSDRDGDTNEK